MRIIQNFKNETSKWCSFLTNKNQKQFSSKIDTCMWKLGHKLKIRQPVKR